MIAKFRFHTLDGDVMELQADPDQNTGTVLQHSPAGTSVVFTGSLAQANNLFVEQGADLMKPAVSEALAAFQAKQCVSSPVTIVTITEPEVVEPEVAEPVSWFSPGEDD